MTMAMAASQETGRTLGFLSAREGSWRQSLLWEGLLSSFSFQAEQSILR